MYLKIIPWQNPLNFVKKIVNNYSQQNPKDNFVFLYSGLDKINQKNFSYLGIFSKEKLITDDFFLAKKIISNSQEKWFGYLSYEVARQFESFNPSFKPFENFNPINCPNICQNNIHFEQFHLVFEFNHSKKIITAIYSNQCYLDQVLNYPNSKIPDLTTKMAVKIKNFSSNFTDQSYLETIKEIKNKIANGDIFQLNLTRKFFGNFDNKIDLKLAFKLFSKHLKFSQTNYSSLIKFDDLILISASPELFFQIKNRQIFSYPIKGTARRSSNYKIDQQNKKDLKKSHKEIAENLMIVDLVRSDLSRVCEIGSVIVKKLFSITSYKNIHHMSSQIHGKLAKNFNGFDALQALFPAGSMTGAPKIMAMNLIADAEKIDRGIYSGAIGFIEGDNNINLAVVIRTLIIKNQNFELQFGGGITYDSNPQFELAEVYNKANSWFKVLGIKNMS
jgi:anthranilate/para-aminobenzoate synthase component I